MIIEGVEVEMNMGFVPIIWISIVFIALMAMGSSLFLGFCIYYDALYRRVENAALWAVLSGLFHILALVYLIVYVTKSPQPMRCMQCGDFLVPTSRFCQRCGRPLNEPSSEQLGMYNSRRRLFFWLWIASIALVIILAALLFALIIGSVRLYF
ncbi:MAG: zinc ribbon domain-containing protein [Oscillospiraceae bacterium]|nr:zinc ribbon domain-containing protein [Oscillospiraceae bacterium]MDD4413340.1 zinc ribbon domain-containing protein [Oscillospiraceae bacterium]